MVDALMNDCWKRYWGVLSVEITISSPLLLVRSYHVNPNIPERVVSADLIR